MRSPPTPLRVDTFEGYELTLRTSFSSVRPSSHRRSRLLLLIRSKACGSFDKNVRTSSSIFSLWRRDGLKIHTSAFGTQYAYAATNMPVAHVLPKRRGQQIMISCRASVHPLASKMAAKLSSYSSL